jgi:hypothetical protein
MHNEEFSTAAFHGAHVDRRFDRWKWARALRRRLAEWSSA